MIRRIEFDALLLSLAREAGAEVVQGVDITRAHEMDRSVVLRSRDGRTFEAPFVIAADGVNGVVGRRLRLNPGWSPTAVAIDMMEETPHDQLRSIDPGLLWVAYGYGGAEGYAYVFPKETHVNVGIGYVLDYYRTRVSPHPWDLQRTFTSELTRRGVLEGTSSRTHFTPYMIPVGGPLPVTATRRVMLAGDAGGFVNGITAEGIYYAMVSGSLAGRAALAGSTAGYARAWRREIGAELRDAVLVQRYLLTTPARVDGLIAAARRAPDLADMVVRYAMGQVSYQTVRRHLLMRSPLLGVRLFVNALLRRHAAVRRVIVVRQSRVTDRGPVASADPAAPARATATETESHLRAHVQAGRAVPSAEPQPTRQVPCGVRTQARAPQTADEVDGRALHQTPHSETGSGALTLIAPSRAGVTSAHRTRSIQSRLWIHGTYCRPEPSRPPRPRR